MDQKKRYATLDGLRGVAALVVVVHHFASPLGLQPTAHGYLAVDFFFMLSGFVIAAAYEDRIVGGASIMEIMRLRVIRLWPMIALGVALGAVNLTLKMRLHHELDLGLVGLMLAAGLLFMPVMASYPGYPASFPLNVPAWSLFFELLVNALYAALARHATTKRLVAVTALSAGFLIIEAQRYGGLTGGMVLTDFACGFARVLFAFSAGVLLYRLMPRLKVRAPFSVLAAALVALLCLPIYNAGWLYDVLCATLAFPLMIAAGANNEGRNAGPLKLAGDISYPLYAIHHPLIPWFGHFARSRGLDIGHAIPLLAAQTAAAVLVAYLAMRFYDAPARRRLASMFRKSPRRPPITALGE